MRITTHAYELAMSHCAAAMPHEGCGVFLGRHEVIDDFQPLRNVSHQPRYSFTVDPEEWIRLIYAKDVAPILGLLHSHPHSAALPSDTDRQLYWPDLPSYWIASFRHPHQPKLSCFRIERSFTSAGEASVQFQPSPYVIDT